MLNDGEIKLHQKLLTRDCFPGRYSIGNIWSIENARRDIKYIFGSFFKGLSINISA